MLKRLRIFAGPNGSGKSSIEKLVSERYNMGIFVNADLIETALRKSRTLDFSLYGITTSQTEINQFITNSGFSEKENPSRLINQIAIRNNVLKLKAESVGFSYLGAILSEVIRNKLLDGNRTFSFETVMSHVSKLDFMKDAKVKNFKTYLYFVSTESPEINILRVRSRVEQGGHDVPVGKIKSMYTKSLSLLTDALKQVDRAFIYDNSGEETILLAEKDSDVLQIFEKRVPEWFNTYVIQKLQQ